MSQEKMPDSRTGMLWLGLYFLCNLALTIYNKYVMQYFEFDFPWILTAIHTGCSGIGCFLAVYPFRVFKPATLGQKENIVMFFFSILYTVNIAVSNISLNMVTVPFHQVVRATTPVFTILMSVMFLKKQFPAMIYVSLLPVILGVALATYGEYSCTWLGFALTNLGTFLAALKTIVTNVVQVGSLKLHPMDLLLRMAPLATMQCLLFAYMAGEVDQLSGPTGWIETQLTSQVFWAILFNGIIAFMLNFVSFTANKVTSALTMTVAANVKQVLSVILSVFIFNLRVTGVNALGIFVTLVGGAWYTWLEMKEKKPAAPVKTGPTYIRVDGGKH